jgi:F-type H+-transporting ATPase subunit epsilon
MADKKFKVTIATPTGVVVDTESESLLAPGTEGYLGILPNHAPLMTGLDVGLIRYRDLDNYDHYFAVTDGFLEVSNNIVTIIADACELSAEIDLERAKQSLERAQERLQQASTDSAIDTERARAAVRRAKNRIEVAEKHNSNN